MRKIREILRLKVECHRSNQDIGKSLAISSSTVSGCLRRFTDSKLGWPLPEEVDDEALEHKLYPPAQKITPIERGEIDWVVVHQELRRKNVTLMLLWNEYREQHPQGLRYSQFCNLYHIWGNRLNVWMRQIHKAGEKLFVDYAGMTMPIMVDVDTGEIHKAQIFVAVWGASSYTFIEASMSQSLPDWIASHVRALEFFVGAPEILVPDNLLSGVTKAHRYEPDINQTYTDMASYYGIAVIPARVSTPKDKPKVEKGVQDIERQILAKLRNRTFFSLTELNQALEPLLDEFNRQPFQKLPGSRLSQFENLDKPALRPLPTTPYEFAEWKKAKAGADYHIELHGHFYSVPYTSVKKELDVRFTSKTVEIFFKSKRIASHMRGYHKNRYTTIVEHMPKAHQQYAEWTPERIINWAGKIGESTEQLMREIVTSRAHPQQGFRSCLGILRLGKSYGDQRLEAACERALSIGALNYKSIESILKNKLDQKAVPSNESEKTSITCQMHEYVRGGDYFK